MTLPFISTHNTDCSFNISRAALERAIFNNELCLYYQPRFHVDKNKIMVLEALVRWVHPHYGLLLPDEFIPLAEESGLIHDLGRWVITQSCRDINRFNDSGAAGDNVRIAVNISILQCERPDTAHNIKKIIHGNNLTLSNFEFELTESVEIHDENAVIEFCKHLSNEGAEISLDDFGTGHSSLTHLSRIPAHALKIDKQFVAQIKESRRDCVLLKHIISMGHDLGARIIAEGIENEAQLNMLIKMGCDELQGFFICRPVRPQALSLWFSNRSKHIQRASLFPFLLSRPKNKLSPAL